jgi:hypothetical protein
VILLFAHRDVPVLWEQASDGTERYVWQVRDGRASLTVWSARAPSWVSVRGVIDESIKMTLRADIQVVEATPVVAPIETK